ncbi:hypothetical protein OVA29_02195 [Exiguobacterium sp. SL14]|nr:hypothetical protein [Exiguobacterium sp. SL14]MCY1689771.1 hypothetical protein [Exiguobacterium sp. SL14]
MTIAEALAPQALAKQHDVQVAVYQNRRFDGDFLTLEQLMEMNEIGDWQVIESRFDRYRPVVRERWREQAGDGAEASCLISAHTCSIKHLPCSENQMH